MGVPELTFGSRHCNPTLVAVGSLTTEGQQEQERYAHDPRVTKFMNSQGKQNLCRCMALANDNSKVEYAYQSVRELKAVGIDIIL